MTDFLLSKFILPWLHLRVVLLHSQQHPAAVTAGSQEAEGPRHVRLTVGDAR